MRNQRGSIQLVIVVILVLVGLVVGVYLVQQRTNILPKAASPNPQTYQPTSSQTIQTDGDLMKTSDNLDSLNVDGIDSALNQNDSDLNTF